MKSISLLIVSLTWMILVAPSLAQQRNPAEAAILNAFMDQKYKITIQKIDQFLESNQDHPKKINLVSLKAKSMYLAGQDREKSFQTFKSVLVMNGRFEKQVWAGVARFYADMESPLLKGEVSVGLEAATKSGNQLALYRMVGRVKSEIEHLRKEEKQSDLLAFLEKSVSKYESLKPPKTTKRSPFSTRKSKVKNPLSVGDKIPGIGDRATWLKGKEVRSFKEGKIYVIDLWATWCGPCIAAMPHVSKIADQYKEKDVIVLGLAFDPKAATPTNEFVDKNEKKIRYGICEDIDGKLYYEYFQRLNLAGIPSILIVNRQGVLAWVGHPNNMDQPLKEIVAGEYDLVKAKKEFANFGVNSNARKSKKNLGTAGRGSKLAKSLSGLLDNLFQKGDKDKDGLLTNEELSNTFAPDGRVLFDPRRLKGMDANEDGKYSRKEIQSYFSRRNSSRGR